MFCIPFLLGSKRNDSHSEGVHRLMGAVLAGRIKFRPRGSGFRAAHAFPKQPQDHFLKSSFCTLKGLAMVSLRLTRGARGAHEGRTRGARGASSKSVSPIGRSQHHSCWSGPASCARNPSSTKADHAIGRVKVQSGGTRNQRISCIISSANLRSSTECFRALTTGIRRASATVSSHLLMVLCSRRGERSRSRVKNWM